MPNRDRQSVEDMLRAAGKIVGYAKGATRETLAAVPMRVDAALYEIVVMGEAARRVSTELRQNHSEIRGVTSLACAVSSLMATIKSTMTNFGR